MIFFFLYDFEIFLYFLLFLFFFFKKRLDSINLMFEKIKKKMMKTGKMQKEKKLLMRDSIN